MIDNNFCRWYVDKLQRYYGHLYAELRFKKRHRFIGTINQVLTVIVGSTAFAAIFEESKRQGSKGLSGKPWVFYILASISILAAIWTAVGKCLNYPSLADAHSSARKKYGKIRSEFVAVLAGGTPKECLEFITKRSLRFSDVEESTPPIPEKCWNIATKEAQKEAKDSTDNMFCLIKCTAVLSDDFLYSGSSIMPMEEGRKWYYVVKNATIKLYQRRLELAFDVEVSYPKTQKKEIYRCEGYGPLDHDAGYVTYTFSSPDNTRRWTGMMLLRIPARGSIFGLWMTTNIEGEDGKIPIGQISFQRSVMDNENAD